MSLELIDKGLAKETAGKPVIKPIHPIGAKKSHNKKINVIKKSFKINQINQY